MSIAFDIEQHEHLARAVRQLGNRALEIDAQSGHVAWGRSMLGPPSRPYPTIRICRRHDAQLAPFRCASLVQHDIHGEPMQPGREGALASETAELVPESHEHILSAVLGIAGVAGETQAERVNTAHVLAV